MFTITEENQKWWVLFAIATCISLIFLDISVLPVALPTIQRELGFSSLSLQWIINAYTLALTISVLAAGRLGDRFGHKRFFCLGIVIFCISSILCGLSSTPGLFIGARALQGIGGAMLMPNAVAILFSAFPPEKRGRALGLYVSIGSVFLALGPFFGGVFSEYFSWRYIFWLNVPVAIAGFLLVLFIVPSKKGIYRHFNFWGFSLSTLGICSIIVGVMQSKEWGWQSVHTLGLIVLGIFFLGCLILFHKKLKDPFIDFSFFKNRIFSGSLIAIFCTAFLLMVTIFWAIYFQHVFGYSPAEAGTLSLLANAPLIIAAPIGGHLVDKHGPRIPIAIGFLLMVGSLFWFLQNLEDKNIWLILSAIIPFGFGIPLVLTPSFTTAIAQITADKRGMASGTCTMFRQFGGTLGLAIQGSLFLYIQQGRFAQNLQRNTITTSYDPQKFDGLLSHSTTALTELDRLPDEAKEYVRQSILEATISAFSAVNILALIVGVIGLLIALSMITLKKQPEIEM